METCSLKKNRLFFNVNWRVEFGVGQFIVFFFRTYVEGWVCGGFCLGINKSFRLQSTESKIDVALCNG